MVGGWHTDAVVCALACSTVRVSDGASRGLIDRWPNLAKSAVTCRWVLASRPLPDDIGYGMRNYVDVETERVSVESIGLAPCGSS